MTYFEARFNCNQYLLLLTDHHLSNFLLQLDTKNVPVWNNRHKPDPMSLYLFVFLLNMNFHRIS